MLKLYTAFGEANTIHQAIENAEDQSSDILDIARLHEKLEIVSISSETLYAEGLFYYIIKTLVHSSGAIEE
jgi:hypothetical protein